MCGDASFHTISLGIFLTLQWSHLIGIPIPRLSVLADCYRKRQVSVKLNTHQDNSPQLDCRVRQLARQEAPILTLRHFLTLYSLTDAFIRTALAILPQCCHCCALDHPPSQRRRPMASQQYLRTAPWLVGALTTPLMVLSSCGNSAILPMALLPVALRLSSKHPTTTAPRGGVEAPQDDGAAGGVVKSSQDYTTLWGGVKAIFIS